MNAAEQQAKQQAQQAQTQLSQTANQSLEATLMSLDQQQATQLQMLTAQGQQQIAAIEGSAQKAIASLQNAINQSASGLRGTLQRFQAQAKSAQAPDPNALSAAVSQAQGQIDGEIGKIGAQVEQGIAASVQSITQSGQQSVEGLSSIGQGAIESATTLSQGLTTTMTGLAQSATDTFKQIQQTHTKTTTETAKTGVDGFKQVSEGIDKTFQEMSKGLESQFQQHVKEVEKALRGALNDLPGVINKEAEDAAAKVDPKKELLKLVVIVAVVVVAALVVGPFAAGLLAPLGAMGTILAGAAVGALSGAAIQMASNALDGKDILEGVGQALLFGAIGGALGAGIGMAVGGVLRGAAGSVASKVGERAGSGLRSAGNFALDVAEETIGDIATNIATGQFSWDNIGESLLFSVVGAGASRSGAGQRISDGAQNRGTQIGNNVSDRVRNAFGGSIAARPNVDVSTPGKPPVSQETAPTKPPVAEETAPVKPPISEEAVPAKPPVTEETTVIKPPAVEETTPAKPPIVEEAVPHKPPVTEETVPTKPPVSQETTPLKSPAAEETTPAKPPVEQETMPTKPPASQETTPVKPPATEETTSTQQPVAGVLGNDVYEATNTYNRTRTEPDGTTTTTTHGALEGGSGQKNLDKLLNKLTKSEYENGAVIKDVVPKSPDNPTMFKVEIPNSTPGQPPHVVEVTVEPLPTANLTPGVHGSETGPARMDLQYVTDASGAGKWTARIELDSALHVQDLPHIIGHEVNEMAVIVSQHPTGATRTTLNEQMAAGVFRDGSTATKPTAHDLAAARELRSLYEDKNNLLKSGASPNKIASREQSIQKTLEWMGLNEPGNIDVKLKTLREAGLPQDVIEQVKLVGARAELQTHINAEQAAGKTQTIFHDEAVNHLMFPEDTGGGFKSSGINGGHQTQRLLDFANNHKSIVVVEQSSKAAGGTTFRKYDQYKWKGTGPKPSLGDPRLPGGSNYNPNDWVKAPYPKTTADDLQGLMREANAGWENFMSTRIAADPNAAPPGPATNNETFGFGMGKPTAIAPGSGIPFGGYAIYDGTRGKWVLDTVFVEETWF